MRPSRCANLNARPKRSRPGLGQPRVGQTTLQTAKSQDENARRTEANDRSDCGLTDTRLSAFVDRSNASHGLR